MAIDHSLHVREAIVAHLRAAPDIGAIVGTRVTGPQVVRGIEWPFLRYGPPVTAAYEATGWEGSEHAVTIHAFAHGPGEDACAGLAAAAVAALDGAEIPLPLGLSLIEAAWTGTQVVFDGDDTNSYHAIITFDVTTVETA